MCTLLRVFAIEGYAINKILSFDCPVPWKFNQLSSCFTKKYLYLIHYVYGVLTKKMLIVTSTN